MTSTNAQTLRVQCMCKMSHNVLIGMTRLVDYYIISTSANTYASKGERVAYSQVYTGILVTLYPTNHFGNNV